MSVRARGIVCGTPDRASLKAGQQKNPWLQVLCYGFWMDEEADSAKFSFRHAGRQAWRKLIDFIVPAKCLICRQSVIDPASLCLACWQGLTQIDAPVCDVMGTPFAYDQGEGAVSAAAIALPPNWDRARAAVGYDDFSRQLVHALKYRDTMEAGLLMARLMGRAGANLVRDADVIVPVPLHRWRLWNRRFNQAAFLAQQLSRQFGKPYKTDILLRRVATRSQVGLKHEERQKNVTKVFEVTPEGFSHISGCRVLLVDDVLTTGATAGSCAASLKKSGAAAVDVLTFALVLEPKRPHIR
jgi:ComF family protein